VIGRVISSNKGSKKSTKRLVGNVKSKELILDVKVDLNMRVWCVRSWIKKNVVADSSNFAHRKVQKQVEKLWISWSAVRP